ncbi:peptidylprolyl isomerase [Dictyobacter aurantiacus]|uniref:PpiC domain-containing protein n=1 Tax=Dictyobacter aurantiacus TaxID=1936993 RepID=A0A401ZCE7_9CHLR|nr:peptidylprolyl isomerase [Dictyobacter aurantiacus]GCE04529.1 hypothetical protein KDAU_18580 [Dictyobacter aurantiacus]
MKNQTARRPVNKRPTRSAQTRTYTRQTAAHVEARRDGQPLIFGWGGHLTKTEKTQLQRLAIWSFIGLIVALVIVVFVGYWINLNVIIPNQPVASVEGPSIPKESIPQSDYHKLVALNGQLSENQMKGKNGLRAQADNAHTKSVNEQKTVDADTKTVNDLTTKLKALPANSNQRADLQKQLDAGKAKLTTDTKIKQGYDTQYNSFSQQETLQEQLFTQSQVGTTSAQWLQEDIVIRNWLNKQSTDIQNKINPSSGAVTKAMNDFKANLPSDTPYSKFLSSSNVSDGDIQQMMALKLRRDNMQSYLASQITSPTRQVNARAITVATAKDANTILNQLKGGADFHKLASQKSLDNNTKSKGGELGWLAPGQYMLDDGSNIAATVDNWLMDPARTNNEFSPVLSENGTFHVLQFESADPSRAVDPAKLKALQGNALKYWIESQKVKGVKLSDPDTNKLFDASNMPSWIPASPPSQSTPGGAPGGAPGGVPGGAPGTSPQG